MLTTEFSAATI